MSLMYDTPIVTTSHVVDLSALRNLFEVIYDGLTSRSQLYQRSERSHIISLGLFVAFRTSVSVSQRYNRCYTVFAYNSAVFLTFTVMSVFQFDITSLARLTLNLAMSSIHRVRGLP
ncbi:hypothetical protein Y032_0010g861 [Ancylostoma ceylanicum]|uniref:Uncharacterized protein n=1 Tax=Ancylostoma ceylanicum TaxID=53326 RepID=A0A016VGT5_9BILA|nr:hypothetical protein Y032_0010g861 [Ancylostoma ceylanicum]